MHQFSHCHGIIELADTRKFEQGLWIGWNFGIAIMPAGGRELRRFICLIYVHDYAIKSVGNGFIGLLLKCVW